CALRQAPERELVCDLRPPRNSQDGPKAFRRERSRTETLEFLHREKRAPARGPRALVVQYQTQLWPPPRQRINGRLTSGFVRRGREAGRPTALALASSARLKRPAIDRALFESKLLCTVVRGP